MIVQRSNGATIRRTSKQGKADDPGGLAPPVSFMVELLIIFNNLWLSCGSPLPAGRLTVHIGRLS